MEKSVRTAIGAKLQTAMKLNRPYTYDDNSVMNTLLGIFPDEFPPSNQLPYVQYAAIGIGGLNAQFIGTPRRLELFPSPHETTHTGLYEQVPYVIRPISNDLSTAERQRYRLRKLIDVGGVTCAAYYLRVLDLSTTESRLEYRVIQDGTITSTPWSPSVNDQHPVPLTVNPGQVLVTGDDYVASTAKTTFQFTSQDINELINVGNMLFNSENAIIVSELALCSGLDVLKMGNFNGANLQYTEAIGVQISDFVSTLLPASFNRVGASINLDIGSVEPLLALASAS